MARCLNGMTREEITRALVDLGEPAYRGGQVARWLYLRRAGSFDEMTDLPVDLRQALGERYEIAVLKRARPAISSRDGAVKYSLGLRDGSEIETVLLPHARGATLCISSQVGCSHACKICATGRMGFKRDLLPEEIVGQVLFMADEVGADGPKAGGPGTRPFGNVVFMGMGEPLANYESTLKAITILIKEVGIGARRITVSTSGLPDEIMRLAREPYEVGLAISLNGTTDEKRLRIMPIAALVPLVKLMNAARYYYATKGRILTFEYVLVRDVNDSVKDAHELASLTREVPAKINLIALNPFPGCRFERPDLETVKKFEAVLRNRGKKVTIRNSLGSDIQAACGQLAGRPRKKKHLKKP
jgi:23S rRNA (adenine2503-C2)-methyltransferase